MRKEGTGGSPQRPQHLESRDTKANIGGEDGGKGLLRRNPTKRGEGNFNGGVHRNVNAAKGKQGKT